MTGFEEVLAAALDARAALITSDDLRPAAPPAGPRPERVWRRRILPALAGLVAAAAICWLLAVTVGRPSREPVRPATPPRPGPAASPCSSTEPEPTPSLGAGPGAGPGASPCATPSTEPRHSPDASAQHSSSQQPNHSPGATPQNSGQPVDISPSAARPSGRP